MRPFVFVLMLVAVLVAAVALIPPAVAQDGDPAAQIVGWVCGNQAWMTYVLGILIAHSGLSVVSAALKKAGITSDSPIVKIIRVLALDVKPPPAQIVAEAQAITARDAPAQAAEPVGPTVIHGVNPRP